MRRIFLNVPDNWHCHLRQGLLLIWMVGMLLRNGFRGRVLVMPNLKNNEVLTGPDALIYLEEIEAALAQYKHLGRFTPVMTIQITEQTTKEMVREAARCGIKVGKVYPRYVTTNSERGVVVYENIYPALEEMVEQDMVACFHFEDPSRSVEGLHKEKSAIRIAEKIRRHLLSLKMVVEHISTRAMLEWVSDQPLNVRGTLAPQHAELTLDDIIGYSVRSGGLMRVHNGCKPQPKFLDDMIAIQNAIMSDDEHFFYGGDDAPHLRRAKECDGSACGVLNTSVAVPMMLHHFLPQAGLDRMNEFFSGRGADHYGYPRTTEKIILEERDWVVPKEYPVPGTGDGVVPLFAGETMHLEIV